MYDCRPAGPNKYYWFSGSVEVSVPYHYCLKVQAVSTMLPGLAVISHLKYDKKKGIYMNL